MKKGALKDYLKGLPGHKILRQVARLNLIAGDKKTAYRFPPDVKLVEIMIMHKVAQRRMIGLNHFWKWNFPVLRFHNDNVDFVVTRVKPEIAEDYPQVPCALFIHRSADDITRIECNNRKPGWILEKLVQATKAEPVPEEEIPHIPLPKVRLQ